MKKRKIGNLKVSEIAMGCMGFSHGYGKIPEKEYSLRAIRKAFDAGCTFFDTAEIYGGQTLYYGHNEEIVGEAVKDFRNKITLATKFHPMLGSLKSEAGIEEIIKGRLEASLKRLDTDYIDLYYLHRTEEGVPVEEVAYVMGKLIKQGMIGGWGLSQVGVDTLSRAHNVTPVTAVQNIYNILERDCEREIFPYCLENNIGVVAFSPVASGLLSGKISVNTEFEKVDDVRNWVPQLTKENIAGNQPIVELLKEYALIKDATPAQIALAWMLHKYPNVVPIQGSKNRERIMENMAAANIDFEEWEFEEFENSLSGMKIYGHRGIIENSSMSARQTEIIEERIVQSAGRDALGSFAPEFAHFNDDILFGENWNNKDLDLKTRSLITVIALMAQGITDSSIKYHIMNAKEHGVTRKEMTAAVTHTAFYAGWPKAWAVFNIAKEVYSE